MEYYEAAAQWCANKLRLATDLASETIVSAKAIDQFEKKLAEIIKAEVEKIGSMTLSVDYGPDCTLSRIAKECGISTDGFPRKTIMWIEVGEVAVNSGYATPIKTIFPSK